MWADPIDRAIDEVAREMTTVAPPGDFRARVVARLDAPARRRPASWTRAVVASCAAAAVAVAMVTYRATRSEVRPQVRSEVRPQVRLKPPQVRLKPDPTYPSPSAAYPGPSATHLSPSATDPGPSATDPGPSAPYPGPSAPRRVTIPPSPIDALAPRRLDVDPLHIDDLVAPLSVDSIAADPLDVPQLDTIAPIAVPPLGAGEPR